MNSRLSPFAAAALAPVLLASCGTPMPPPPPPAQQTFSWLMENDAIYQAGLANDKIFYNPDITINPAKFAYTLPYALASFEQSHNVRIEGKVDESGASYLSVAPLAVGATSPAFGPLLALSILNLIPTTPGYEITPSTAFKYPFLDFYKIIPTDRAKKMPAADYLPYFKQSYQLILAAHNGVPIGPGSLNFKGFFYSGTTQPAIPVYGYAHLTSESMGVDFQRLAIPLLWHYPGDEGNPITGSTDPDGGILQINYASIPSRGKFAVPNAGTFVEAEVGRPAGFYTATKIDKIAGRYPFVSKWYAVYSTPHDGQIEIAVQHNGKVLFFTKQAS